MNNSKLEQQAVKAAAQSIASANLSLDKPDTCAKTSDDYHWRVMTCIRACEGDHTAGLVLNQLLYWWPKKYAHHRGVKKSLSDWKGELMLGRKQAERINSVLVNLGFVEIYQDKWGHFKSPSTFYVLTDKAFALDKPLAPKGHVVEQPLVQKVQVTENTYKPTENTKETKDFVDASLSTEATPINPSEQTGKDKPQNQNVLPDAVIEPPRFCTASKKNSAGLLWASLVVQYLPEHALPLKVRDWKNARDLCTRIDGMTDLPGHEPVLRWVIQNWVLWAKSIGYADQVAPHKLTTVLDTAVAEYRKERARLAEKQAYAAQMAKASAEIEALQAEKAAAPAPVKKLSKIAQLVADEAAAKAAKQTATPLVEPCACAVMPAPAEPPVKPAGCPFVTLEDGHTWQDTLDAWAAESAREMARLKAVTEKPKILTTSANMFQNGKPKHAKTHGTA